MKKFILLLFLVAVFNACVCQVAKTKDFYFTKSKHQKTLAWILLGSGAGMTALGFAIAHGETVSYFSGTGVNEDFTGEALAIVGLAAAAASIPVFISAAHNKRKGATFSFKLQRVPLLLSAYHPPMVAQPSLSVRIFL